MSECLSSTQACSILNLPDEIQVYIISYCDAKERLELADSCQRFNNLVFKDARLLRDLDYSKHKNLTVRDVYRYFGNEERRNHVRRVNIEYVNFMGPGEGMLRDLISQAMNLVDINILGQNFDDIKELRNFLEPFVHLRRLSVNWPNWKTNDFYDCRKFLATRFSNLTYLSTKIDHRDANVFLATLQFWTELEELRITSSYTLNEVNCSWSYRPHLDRNEKLKIIYLNGVILPPIRRTLVSMLSDPSEWTEIRGFDGIDQQSYYFEKNLKVCEKLRDTVFKVSESGLVLVSHQRLLEAVIKITHEDTPEGFCCIEDDNPLIDFFSTDNLDREGVLNIDEAKRLLKDSGYQISYLNTFTGLDSDAHLIASAFNNITKLVSSECGYDESKKELRQSQKRLKKRGTDMKISKSHDLPFKLFVENTPNLRELDMSIISSFGSETRCLISRWENLRKLRLGHLRAEDAAFLIDIGKNCPELEILDLYENWSCDLHTMQRCTDDLLEMLNIGCRNLKEFMIEDNIPYRNKLLKTLSKHLNLRKVKIISHVRNDYYLGSVAAIEQLIRECPKLEELIFGKILTTHYHEFGSALQRAKVELNRPNFRFLLERSEFEELSSSSALSLLVDPHARRSD